jgi:hypothetical protein
MAMEFSFLVHCNHVFGVVSDSKLLSEFLEKLVNYCLYSSLHESSGIKECNFAHVLKHCAMKRSGGVAVKHQHMSGLNILS